METTIPKARSITTIDQLQVGDRFVFAKDKKQRVFTKIAHEAKKTKYTIMVYWALQDGQRHPVSLSSNTLLKFLRRPEVVNN